VRSASKRELNIEREIIKVSSAVSMTAAERININVPVAIGTKIANCFEKQSYAFMISSYSRNSGDDS
jgi:hypothetical protein